MHEQLEKEYKLTQYSHGAGCGCKIAPAVLDKMLGASAPSDKIFPNLLVGNKERDDAAVMDMGDGTAVVSTTDFFMPIVDDPLTFGKIAATNAISDIYAMGANPMMAIAILGWPIKELPPEVAGKVIEGGRLACEEAGIPLAGGHSIDCPEPVFGLAVTGRVEIKNLKKNGGAKPGASLFLSKPIGVGILATAQKKGKLIAEHQALAIKSMTTLNKAGATFGLQDYIQAMTDVTGFGLLGHLSEMCEASDASAHVYFDKVPQLDKAILQYYLDENCIPGGTNRNWDSYGHKIGSLTDHQKHILCDPQTSGGLLVAVGEGKEGEFKELALTMGLQLEAIGKLVEKREELVTVI